MRAKRAVRAEIQRQVAELAGDIMRRVTNELGTGPAAFTVLLLSLAAFEKRQREAGDTVPPEVQQFAKEAGELAWRVLDYLEVEVPKKMVQ